MPPLFERALPLLGRSERCETCHAGADREGLERVTPRHLASHPRRRTLFSLHPVARFGCTACHGGDGSALTREAAHAEGPPQPWGPFRRGVLLQSSCLRCHGEEVDLRADLLCERDAECPAGGTCFQPGPEVLPERRRQFVRVCLDREGGRLFPDLAPALARGRKILAEAGCDGCHEVPGRAGRRRPGPDLSHVGAKLDPAWLEAWVRDPARLRPGTRMPAFPGAPSAALAAFLRAASTPFALPPAPAGDPQRGRRLTGALGCLACHRIAGTGRAVSHRSRASHFDHGPPLDDLGARTSRDWVFAWLKDPQAYAPGTRMPDFRLDDREAADIAAFLVRRRERPPAAAPPAAPLVAQGRRLARSLGCPGCHRIPGLEAERPRAPALADIAKRGLRGRYAHDAPGGPLPRFLLDEQEALAVQVALLGLRGADRDAQVLRPRLDPEDLLRERGREVAHEYNCHGCHPFDEQEGDLWQLFPAARRALVPPALGVEGFRVRGEWLRSFLADVRPLRPWLAARMPSFRFTEEELGALVGMFKDLSFVGPGTREKAHPVDAAQRAIGLEMMRALGCQTCHDPGRKGWSEAEALSAGPDLRLAGRRLRREFVLCWLDGPGQMVPGTAMPAFFAGGNVVDALLATPGGQARLAGLDGIEEVRRGGNIAQLRLLTDVVLDLDAGRAAPAPGR